MASSPKWIVPAVLGTFGFLGILISFAREGKAEATPSLPPKPTGDPPNAGPKATSAAKPATAKTPTTTFTTGNTMTTSAPTVGEHSEAGDPSAWKGDPMRYSTALENLDFHPKGGLVPFGDSGEYVTALPLIDTQTGLFARVTPATLRAFAASVGSNASLLTAKDVDAIETKYGHIEPAQGPAIEPTNTNYDHMESLEWAKKWDDLTWKKLNAKGYDGTYPINIAKDWLAGPTAVNYGFFTNAPLGAKGAGGPYQGNLQGVRQWQTEGGKHNDSHTDYSQLGRIKLMKPAGGSVAA